MWENYFFSLFPSWYEATNGKNYCLIGKTVFRVENRIQICAVYSPRIKIVVKHFSLQTLGSRTVEKNIDWFKNQF